MGQACLADFGLIGIISDGTNITSSGEFVQGGTHRWMSPELFDPEKFNLKDSRPTKYSDCYALGMVIYEVLSGMVPFCKCGHYLVVVKVLAGEHPGRPEGILGAWFTDRVWEVLERCWTQQPRNRPSIDDVLRCLEKVSTSWVPPSPRLLAVKSAADSLTVGSILELHSVATTVPSASIGVEQHIHSLDNVKPSMSTPIVVRRFFACPAAPLLTVCTV